MGIWERKAGLCKVTVMSPVRRAVSVQVLPEADIKVELEAQEIYQEGYLGKIKEEGSWSRRGKPETTVQIRGLWRKGERRSGQEEPQVGQL